MTEDSAMHIPQTAPDPAQRPLHRVLWTSGWDSTFRILDLVSRRDCIVQPYYILDPDRRSHRIEIARMEEIVAATAQRGWSGEVRPVEIIPKPDTAAHPDIEEAWRRIRAQHNMAGQYQWLAVAARERGLSALETGVLGSSTMGSALAAHLVRQDYHGEEIMVLDTSPDDPLHTIFENMTFPLFGTKKPAMRTIAEQRSFIDLLERAWFCNKPLRNNHACGLCNPCRDAVTGGMGYRLGWRGRLLHRLPGFPVKPWPSTIQMIGRGILGRI